MSAATAPAPARVATRRRLSGPLRALALIDGAGLLALAAVVLAAEASGRSHAFFTREPITAVAAEPCSGWSCSYAGALSNATVLVWWTAAVLALAAAALAVPSARRGLLLACGAFSAVLAIDDVALVHDSLYAFGEHGEHAAYGLYALVVAAILVRFRRELLRTPWPAAVAAGLLFGVSVGADQVASGHHLVEDGAKLLGALTWAWYLGVVGLSVLPRR